MTKEGEQTNIKLYFRLVGGIKMSYIERAITPILKRRVEASKCVLITGARLVGKSTLVKHEYPEYNRANFDDWLTRLQAKEEPKLFFLNHPCPLFIDEVQKENSI